MFSNYLKTAWRNLIKNKVFSFINIAGLSVGMAACLLILQYVSFELSYDRFNKNAADIYRVITTDTKMANLYSTVPSLIRPLAKL